MSESYYSTSDPQSRKRYNKKTKFITSKDPYTLSEDEFSVGFDNIPLIFYSHIVNCIQTKSILPII